MNSLILHGRRSFELQKWRVSVKLLQNYISFSSAIAADVSPPQDCRKGKIFTVSYLVDSLGFTTKLAESISRKVVSFEGKSNPDSVLNLLTSHGFTDSQISSIVRTYPRLLIADAEKSLAPKLRFLQSRGASTSELTEIISKVPKILGVKKDKAISVYYDFVKDIIESDKSSEYEMSCLSLPEGSAQENIIRNVLVLRESGVPQRSLFSLLISKSRYISGKERFEESLKKVVKMGFDPTTSKFVQALCVVCQLSDKTIEEKVSMVYKSLGFAVGDVWAIFRKYPLFLAVSEKKILNSIDTYLDLGFSRDEFVMIVWHYPQCIGLSAESVKKKTEFLVKKMNWSLRDVVKTLVTKPQVLGCSLEDRIVPRCNLIKALMSKGLLGSELPSIGSVLGCTNEVFLKRFVRKHGDKKLVAELMAISTRDRVS